ncbi:MAG: hypothetical protein HJJLKODD_00567 [Phycisphaerae bacterium]|nr:hypothetical protein [Phycisphaerae bacterium]
MTAPGEAGWKSISSTIPKPTAWEVMTDTGMIAMTGGIKNAIHFIAGLKNGMIATTLITVAQDLWGNEYDPLDLINALL